MASNEFRPISMTLYFAKVIHDQVHALGPLARSDLELIANV
jgi:hypothetical protein